MNNKYGTEKKTWKAREFAALLKQNGYRLVRSNGDHMIYRNDAGRTISYNIRGHGPNRMVIRRLIREYGLSTEPDG